MTSKTFAVVLQPDTPHLQSGLRDYLGATREGSLPYLYARSLESSGPYLIATIGKESVQGNCCDMKIWINHGYILYVVEPTERSGKPGFV